MAKKGAYAHIWAYLFWPIGMKMSMGTQETILYRLVARNQSYDAYFSVLIFLATFGGKMGVANRYLEIMFSKFPGVNPPPLNGNFYILNNH